MSDYEQIANRIARYFAAVDGRDWPGARALMTDPFHLDYSSFGGGDPADLDPDDILRNWRAFLPGFDHTHHQIGNLDIEVAGDTAKAGCYVTATHAIDDRVWTVVGTYDIALARTDDGWRLSGLRLDFKYQTGATDLAADAQRHAAALAG